MARDPEVLAHQEWIGYVQPVGLLVSIPALLAAQANVGKISPAEHQQWVATLPRSKDDEPKPHIADLHSFVQTFLGWQSTDLIEPPPSLEVVLTSFNETLRPTFVVPYFKPKNPDRPWQMLVQCLPTGADFDTVQTTDHHHWQATPQARLERLLRETDIPIGLLFNHAEFRIVYAPRGESSGYATFKVSEMMRVSGRPIWSALLMLLAGPRLFSLPEKQRLPAILLESRKYQNVVSNQLAEQVLAALYELLRGFQAADDATQGQLLKDVLAKEPDQVASGLLNTLLRLVFILYAEDRGLLSADTVYVNHYSVTGLFERLRADAGRYPDTMDRRYGAWAQLLVLFRLIFEGGGHGNLFIPARQGYLFDPQRYLFLEGRRYSHDAPSIPRVSDGVVFRVLSNLLILDGERLSYRSLDVEQIGSVYETIMGFNLEVAKGPSIAIKPTKAHGAPATINLAALLEAKPAERGKLLNEWTGQKLTGAAADGLKKASTKDELEEALDKKIARHVTPHIVSQGSMILQPSEERRRSGSHYTPRTLTNPIVLKTLEPILKQLGEKPTPQQILNLKVCDPAMGSGAFLVEACRQLSESLVEAWGAHQQMPVIPPDEDEVLHARRLIAQRCLYGVDKNPMATDLAKLSLWLATLAKDHPFTFLDHSLRCGDSLVGLTKQQIVGFHWLPTDQKHFGQEVIEERLVAALRDRQAILDAGDEASFLLKEQKLILVEESLNLVRYAGDLILAAFYNGKNDKERKLKRDAYLQQFSESLRTGIRSDDIKQAVSRLLRDGVRPFHWEIEFPEVFSKKGGFDAIIGNPPFAGKNTIAAGHHPYFLDWLKALHAESHGNADLVAHFFRRAFNLLRIDGTFGLIATNTIAQGDTRSTGLRWICSHEGTIYDARRRYKWPGLAAVVVSVVHVAKGNLPGPYILDDKEVPITTAYLFHAGGHDDPAKLKANERMSFIGSYVLGMGFTFDDTDKDGVANSIRSMHDLIEKDQRNAERIFPFIGGEEVNDSPTHQHSRYVIDFGDMPEIEAYGWPDLMNILEEKVKPERMMNNREGYRRYWWQYAEKRVDLRVAIERLDRVLVNVLYGPYLCFTFLSAKQVFTNKLNIVATDRFSKYSILQCRIHETWARFFSSTLKDDLAYAPSDCLETFPFPQRYETDATLEEAGQEYFEYRAALMVKNNEGLTKTYNRFHDPNETSEDIKKLRELHTAMDRAVLDAYGWKDLQPTCDFFLEYEEEEDEDETGKARKKKKPYRYRWPDEFRDEVLARLLELNKVRAEEERLSGEVSGGKKKQSSPRKKKSSDDSSKLFQ
jgi:hypothetical protein